LKVHLDSNSEPSVSDVVVCTAVAPTYNVVRSGFGDDVAVVERSVHVVLTARDRIHVEFVVHAVVVEADSVKVVAVHDAGGGVDD